FFTYANTLAHTACLLHDSAITLLGRPHMTVAWHLDLADLHCRVEWRDGQMYWLLRHPNVPGGETRPAHVSDMTVDHHPVQWTHLIGANETRGPDAAPRLSVTVQDSTGRLRLVRHFELFAGHAFARTWGVVERIDDADESTAPQIDGAAILHISVDAPDTVTLLHVEQFSWPYHKDFFNRRQIPLVPNLTPHEVRMGSFPAHY